MTGTTPPGLSPLLQNHRTLCPSRGGLSRAVPFPTPAYPASCPLPPALAPYPLPPAPCPLPSVLAPCPLPSTPAPCPYPLLPAPYPLPPALCPCPLPSTPAPCPCPLPSTLCSCPLLSAPCPLPLPSAPAPCPCPPAPTLCPLPLPALLTGSFTKSWRPSPCRRPCRYAVASRCCLQLFSRPCAGRGHQVGRAGSGVRKLAGIHSRGDSAGEDSSPGLDSEPLESPFEPPGLGLGSGPRH